MTRDEAMRAAANANTALWPSLGDKVAAYATAGADAELGRVVDDLRADSRRWMKLCLEASPEGQRVMRAIIEELREKADRYEARAHWPKESDDG